MKFAALFWMLSFATSAWALDDAAVRKTLKDLESPDPKIRIAAIQELAPLFADMTVAWSKAQRDRDPAVVRAFALAEHARINALRSDPIIMGKTIAANERMAASKLLAFAEAQEIYKRTDYDRDGILEYAPTARGLYETKEGTKDLMLIDEAFMAAFGDPKTTKPVGGYFFKVLKKQGPATQVGKGKKNGALEYIVKDNMTEGFAILAFPAQYQATGKTSFILSSSYNPNSIVFGADLGPDTLSEAEKTEAFNPDPKAGWIPAE